MKAQDLCFWSCCLILHLWKFFLWTFSDMLATFCFTWVAEKLILMFEFSHTTTIQRTVTSCIWEMMTFSYGFIKCIDLFCHQFSSYKFFANFHLPSSLLELFFLHCFANTSLLLGICFNLFSLKQFNLPFSQDSHFVTSCLYFWPF